VNAGVKKPMTKSWNQLQKNLDALDEDGILNFDDPLYA